MTSRDRSVSLALTVTAFIAFVFLVGAAVEVASPGPRFDVPPAEPPDDAVSGRGLFLVDRIADRPGSDSTSPAGAPKAPAARSPLTPAHPVARS